MPRVDEIVADYEAHIAAKNINRIAEAEWLRQVFAQPITPKAPYTWSQWLNNWFGFEYQPPRIKPIIHSLKRRQLLTARDELLIEIFWHIRLEEACHWHLLEQHVPRAAFAYSMCWVSSPYFCIGDLAPYQAVFNDGWQISTRCHRLLHRKQLDMYVQLVTRGIVDPSVNDLLYFFNKNTSPVSLIRAWYTVPKLEFRPMIHDGIIRPSTASTTLLILEKIHGSNRIFFYKGIDREALNRAVDAQLIFALIVATSEGLFRPNNSIVASFFRIAARLPLELQIDLMRCVVPEVTKIRAIGDAEILWLGA